MIADLIGIGNRGMVRKDGGREGEEASNELPLPFRHLIDRLTEHLKELDRQVKQFEGEIVAWHRSSEVSRKLEKIPGIGPLAASALVASNRHRLGVYVVCGADVLIRYCSRVRPSVDFIYFLGVRGHL